MPKRFPAYGRQLDERLKSGDVPRWVLAFIGRGAWERAKETDLYGGKDALLVIEDVRLIGSYRWPVQGCAVSVDIGHGPDVEQSCQLARLLIWAGAKLVLLSYRDWGVSRPIVYWPNGDGKELTADWFEKNMSCP